MQLYFSILFNSASRQYHEVWAMQFSFLHNFKDTLPLSEAFLYGCINWSLTEDQKLSSHGLCQSLTCMIGC